MSDAEAWEVSSTSWPANGRQTTAPIVQASQVTWSAESRDDQRLLHDQGDRVDQGGEQAEQHPDEVVVAAGLGDPDQHDAGEGEDEPERRATR